MFGIPIYRMANETALLVQAGVPLRAAARRVCASYGFNTGAIVGTVIGATIAILVAIALLPTIAYQAKTAQTNASVAANSTAVSLLPLVTTLFVIVVVLVPVAVVMYMLHNE